LEIGTAGRPQRRARIAAGLPAPTGNGTRPPFSPGNTAAETHGSYRSDLALSRDERVAELAESIEATQPVSHPADAGGIWRLALVYRRLERSAAALDEVDGMVAEKPTLAYGQGREWLDRLRADHARWLRAASQIEAELGRTPLSRSKLGLNVAAAQKLLGADLVERYGGRVA
jgi:hypothetical protein